MRATITELVTATEIAKHAPGLKVTVHKCDVGLGQRLQPLLIAFCDELDGRVDLGQGRAHITC